MAPWGARRPVRISHLVDDAGNMVTRLVTGGEQGVVRPASGWRATASRLLGRAVGAVAAFVRPWRRTRDPAGLGPLLEALEPGVLGRHPQIFRVAYDAADALARLAVKYRHDPDALAREIHYGALAAFTDGFLWGGWLRRRGPGDSPPPAGVTSPSPSRAPTPPPGRCSTSRHRPHREA